MIGVGSHGFGSGVGHGIGSGIGHSIAYGFGEGLGHGIGYGLGHGIGFGLGHGAYGYGHDYGYGGYGLGYGYGGYGLGGYGYGGYGLGYGYGGYGLGLFVGSGYYSPYYGWNGGYGYSSYGDSGYDSPIYYNDSYTYAPVFIEETRAAAAPGGNGVAGRSAEPEAPEDVDNTVQDERSDLEGLVVPRPLVSPEEAPEVLPPLDEGESSGHSHEEEKSDAKEPPAGSGEAAIPTR